MGDLQLQLTTVYFCTDAGKDWGQEKKGATEDEMVGWHHWHDGHEFEQTLGDNEGPGSLVCYIYSPWGHKESDTTERLNWTVYFSIIWAENYWILIPN